jgi:hypothetical protein
VLPGSRFEEAPGTLRELSMSISRKDASVRLTRTSGLDRLIEFIGQIRFYVAAGTEKEARVAETDFSPHSEMDAGGLTESERLHIALLGMWM